MTKKSTRPMSVIDRAVRNSPPPLDDAGGDVRDMLDEMDPYLASFNQSDGRDLKPSFNPGWFMTALAWMLLRVSR
jgi:hypothetical protein